MKKSLRFTLGEALAVFVILAFATPMISAAGREGGPARPERGGFAGQAIVSRGIFSGPMVQPHAKIYGKTYGEWSAEWWKWVLAVPGSTNPLVDSTGEFCAEGQDGKVWYLAGTFGGSAERNCSVPAGRPVFFPLLNFLFICTEPGETEAIARESVNSGADKIDALEVNLDGKPVPMLRNHRAESPAFNTTFPEGNLFGIAPGVYGPSVSDGYWVMLFLKPGNHELSFSGKKDDFELNVTYHLTVE